MRGNSLRGNRESPETPIKLERMGRSGKAECRNPDMNVSGQSDSPIVPGKQPNKAGGIPVAEAVEERGLTKGNDLQTAACRTQGRESASFWKQKVRRAARSLLRHSPEVGAVCGNSARTDLCGGLPARAVPTATKWPSPYRISGNIPYPHSSNTTIRSELLRFECHPDQTSPAGRRQNIQQNTQGYAFAPAYSSQQDARQ